jgi:gliding motility-associated-like protein
MILSVNAIDNAFYSWQDDSTADTLYVTSGGNYWVEISANECESVYSINVHEVICDPIVELPNVFTPNGDELNDFFKPSEAKYIKLATLTIYNRWGQLLFQTSEIVEGWNGQVNGEVCGEGTYYWTLEYFDFLNRPQNHSGFLNLIK